MGKAGGINLYRFVYNDPMGLVDPYGEDAYTIGPVTVYIPFTTEWYEKFPEEAHEAQHRKDWRLKLPGWKKEQRGFAEEVKAWKKQIDAMQEAQKALKKLCPGAKGLEEEIAEAESSMLTAQTLATSDQAAMIYWNTAARRWYQTPVSPAPPLPPNWTPPVLNVSRNRAW